VRFHFFTELFQASRRNNVVSIEDGPCFVAADLHRFFLAESGFDHVRERRSPQVVIKIFGNSGGFAGTLPDFSKSKTGFPSC
jgi:hypothetical protein